MKNFFKLLSLGMILSSISSFGMYILSNQKIEVNGSSAYISQETIDELIQSDKKDIAYIGMGMSDFSYIPFRSTGVGSYEESANKSETIERYCVSGEKELTVYRTGNPNRPAVMKLKLSNYITIFRALGGNGDESYTIENTRNDESNLERMVIPQKSEGVEFTCES